MKQICKFIGMIAFVLIGSGASFAHVATGDMERRASERELKKANTQLALVVSDKAARTFIQLFSNAAQNAEDAARGTQVEEKENEGGGVKVERVEDLDVRVPSNSHRRENDYNDR